MNKTHGIIFIIAFLAAVILVLATGCGGADFSAFKEPDSLSGDAGQIAPSIDAGQNSELDAAPLADSDSGNGAGGSLATGGRTGSSGGAPPSAGGASQGSGGTVLGSGGAKGTGGSGGGTGGEPAAVTCVDPRYGTGLDCPKTWCHGPAGNVAHCCYWTTDAAPAYLCGCPLWDQFGNDRGCGQ